MFSVEEIRENYKKLSNAEIEKLARYESKTLRREVLGILKDEIKLRNLSADLILWVDAETNTFTDLEKKILIQKIEKLPCPSCREQKTLLSGHTHTTIISMLIVCKQREHKKILCARCGRNEKFTALFKTFLFGWWSRTGFFLTPYLLLKSPFSSFFKQKHHQLVLDDFLHKHNGILRLQGTESDVLEEIIKKYNTPI